MARTGPSPALSYAGAALVLALVLGGGTGQGMWTDHLLEMIMLPALFLGLGGLRFTRLGVAGRLLAVLILVVLLVQFLPLGRSLAIGSAPAVAGVFFSPAPQRSLEAGLFSLSVLGFFLYVARLSDDDQERCLPFLLLGFLVNFVAAAFQLSYGERARFSGFLPFTVTAGLFANENHFSSLVCMVVPLVAYVLLFRWRRTALYLLAAFMMVGLLFAVGSRAGMALAGALAVLSLFWFVRGRRLKASKPAALLAGAVVLAIFSVGLDFAAALDAGSRSVFFATTARAIADHWPLGTGLGTFMMIYPAYEARENIMRTFVNHAHNDYLEIVLETGISGAVLIAFFFLLICRNFTRCRFAEAAFIAVMAVCLHSLVDYPLRTAALAVPFAYLAAVILSVRPFDGGHASGASKPRP